MTRAIDYLRRSASATSPPPLNSSPRIRAKRPFSAVKMADKKEEKDPKKAEKKVFDELDEAMYVCVCVYVNKHTV